MGRLKRTAWALGALMALGAQAQVFKWTDPQGNAHYGDRPPPDAKAQEMKIYSIPPTAPLSDVEVLPTEVEPYTVRGVTLREIFATMREAAPKDEEGRPRWGMARWKLTWKFAHDATRGCRIDNFTITVASRLRMPEWPDRAIAPPKLQGQWDSFYRALRIHEDGHRDNGIHAGNDLARRIRGLGDYRDCEALNADISNIGNRIIGEYRLVDRAYDRSTDHGVTQGAVFR